MQFLRFAKKLARFIRKLWPGRGQAPTQILRPPIWGLVLGYSLELGCWCLVLSLALVQWQHTTFARTGVFRQRPDEPVIRELLHHVRRPARDARHYEERRKHVDVKTHHVIRRAAGEIEIGMDFFLLNHCGSERV